MTVAVLLLELVAVALVATGLFMVFPPATLVFLGACSYVGARTLETRA